MNESPFVDIFFELLNIVVAIGIGTYIFRSHMLDSIKQEMRNAANYLLKLIQSKKDTRDQCKVVDKNIVDDFEYGQRLLKNIEKWSTGTERMHEEQRVGRVHQETVMKERIAVQERTLHDQELRHKAGDELVKQLRSECATMYRDKQPANLFMKHIFDQLKRESS